jgi:hypothetical protein
MRFVHWFPLIPRPRPPADSLNARVERLAAAGRTARSGSGEEALAAAAQVYNGAALLASDLGLPDLARDWCWEHTHAYLTHLPLNATMAQRALEPVVNLARLRIRAGNGTEAFAMLTALHKGVRTATPTVIDGYELPLDQLTVFDRDRAELHRWLWTVCLGDGIRALATEGRWQEAATHAQQHGGIGDRLFDGRQVAVIAALTGGDPRTALAMAEDSEVREPWEKAVQAVLALWCRNESAEVTASDVETAIDRVRDVDNGRVVFTTRLGIIATDLLGRLQRDASELTSQLVVAIVRAQDGYAARDLFTAWRGKLSHDQMNGLIPVLEASGLGQKIFPEPALSELRSAINEANRRLEDRSIPV